ncbi:uncharacterized protein LOC112515221 [Cynara cardunculus var. scolymus]|uniref:uncharacterized protein LOC112515221 n=1 Tax=Cynara cardunculus var. scolymus TaxID=59895 RepID=UPI000D62E2C0|nr:uncharacterized protein LOC112515221 [Cynara cardunculus var. scolymus]
MKGNWKAAKDIFEKHEELVRFSINRNCETTLHVAAYEGNTLFVKNLVTLMENKDMELQNSSSNTALCLAAVAGHVEMAEIMVTKNKTLLDIAGSEGKMPLYMAALSGRHDMVKYLYENSERMTGGFWTHESRGCVLLSCVEAELFDVALQIVNDRPELAVSGGIVLGVLARKPHAFMNKRTFIEKLTNKYKRLIDEENQALKLLRIIWAHIVKLPKAKIDDILRGPADPIMEDDKLTQKYSSRILFVAAGMGNTAFIVELIRQYPERVLELDDNNQTIFHVAISHRHFSIYSLLYEIGSIKDSVINLEDGKGNNMLHLVGILEETTMIMSNQLQNISGAVLQMRQELVWFELHLSEVKAILPPSLREKKNTAGLSPHELFTENHKGLVSKALIVTVSFAAAITFVGGYNQDNDYITVSSIAHCRRRPSSSLPPPSPFVSVAHRRPSFPLLTVAVALRLRCHRRHPSSLLLTVAVALRLRRPSSPSPIVNR